MFIEQVLRARHCASCLTWAILLLIAAPQGGSRDDPHSRDVGIEPQKDFGEKWARPLSIPGHDTHSTERETEAERAAKSQTVARGQVPGAETFPTQGGPYRRKARTTGREVRPDPRLGSCENADSETHSQRARHAQKIAQEKQPGLVDRALHRTRCEPPLCRL